jgi:hypothetical protein
MSAIIGSDSSILYDVDQFQEWTASYMCVSRTAGNQYTYVCHVILAGRMTNVLWREITRKNNKYQYIVR